MTTTRMCSPSTPCCTRGGPSSRTSSCSRTGSLGGFSSSTASLQSGAPFYRPGQLESVCNRLASSFGAVRPFLAPVPTYAGGMLALVAAGEDHKTLRPSVKVLRERFQRIVPYTRYYTPEVHRAAFVLAPVFAPVTTRETGPDSTALGITPDTARTAA
jgi:hypothetical protein